MAAALLAPALLAAALVLVSARDAPAHEVGPDRLLLLPDAGRGELRGQISLNPHHTRADPPAESDTPPAPETGAAVTALIDRALSIELDGRRCRPKYVVRELWSPGAPTVGDVVTLRCALPSSATRVRVSTAVPMDPLIVTVQTRRNEGDVETQMAVIRDGDSTPDFSLGQAPRRASMAAQAWRYLVLGVEHIVPRGLDHVLFVVSLVLAPRVRFRPLILQLSAFTLAHSITLALGTLGWVRVLPSVIEPLIALSIAVVALDNLRQHPGIRSRAGVVFGFGLLHGLGFAGVLAETGLSGSVFLVGIVSFNAGVELGQMFVVAGALALLALLPTGREHSRAVLRVASGAIAAVGLWWALARLLA